MSSRLAKLVSATTVYPLVLGSSTGIEARTLVLSAGFLYWDVKLPGRKHTTEYTDYPPVYTPNENISTAPSCLPGNDRTLCCSFVSTLYCSTIFFWFSNPGTLNMVMRVMRPAALSVGDDMLLVCCSEITPRYLVAKTERIAN